jgi:hypothetical protein
LYYLEQDTLGGEKENMFNKEVIELLG